MKFIIFALLLIPALANAETYICSYPNYADGEPVIIKLEINGETATDISDQFKTQYKVLKNNEFGVVLVHSFSSEGINSSQQNSVGLFGLVIDKIKMKMIRGNIIYGENSNSLKLGTCTK
ncbi:MAG: hypothetical protein JW773_06780 [Desulfuromonadales bacterium]|nr:hypothetical protein [Desulfuromonadales bacterium]